MKRSFAYAAADAQRRVQNLGPLFAKMPDICARKHGGSPESVEAHKTIRGGLHAQRERVYAEIRSESDQGLTVDECAVVMSTTPNAISGRFSELARDGRIQKIGQRKTRSGCWAAVWRAI